MTGDIDKAIEQTIIARGSLGTIDVLKVAHHGSREATGKVFLGAVQPTVAIISSGKGNRHGHPHTELLECLKKQDVIIFRTDMLGSIEIISDGRSFALVHPKSGGLIKDLSDYCVSASSR